MQVSESIDGTIGSESPSTTRWQRRSGSLFRWSALTLGATVWTSALLFGLYILAFYAAAIVEGEVQTWNEGLPGLYEPDKEAATTGIGLHFAAGGIILILGCVQLLENVRRRFLRLHRWLGHLYIGASIVAALGGLTFIAVNGTIGGTVMDIGFSLYGILMLVAAIETIRHARAKRLSHHKVWALRLFALAIGSWLYRMDYGFWFMLADGVGHTNDFRGPFDRVMAFFFYLPNLLVVEVWTRTPRLTYSPVTRTLAAVVLLLATAFLVIGTYYFTKYEWGPAIVAWLPVGG